MFMFGMKVAKTPASPLQIQPATLWSDRHDLQVKNIVDKESRTGVAVDVTGSTHDRYLRVADKTEIST